MHQRIFKKHFWLLILRKSNLEKWFSKLVLRGQGTDKARLTRNNTQNDNGKSYNNITIAWYNNSHDFSPSNGSEGFSFIYFFPNEMLNSAVNCIIFKVVILFFVDFFVRGVVYLYNALFIYYVAGMNLTKVDTNWQKHLWKWTFSFYCLAKVLWTGQTKNCILSRPELWLNCLTATGFHVDINFARF